MAFSLVPADKRAEVEDQRSPPSPTSEELEDLMQKRFESLIQLRRRGRNCNSKRWEKRTPVFILNLPPAIGIVGAMYK